MLRAIQRKARRPEINMQKAQSTVGALTAFPNRSSARRFVRHVLPRRLHIHGWTDDQLVRELTKSQAIGLIFIRPLPIMALDRRAGGTSEGLLQLGQ